MAAITLGELGSVLVGLFGRAGLVLVAGLALALPALVAAMVWRFGAERSRRASLRTADGLAYHHAAYHAPNHTWLLPRGSGELAVGIDDLARRILPSATSVDLPRPGSDVHRGDPIAVIRAGKRTIQIGAPVDGTIVAVNASVRRNPELVRDASYGAGWLFTIAPADGGYMRFPHGDEAAEWMRGERRRLARFLEGELGIAAADGGELPAPTPALLGEESWKRLSAAFLR
ncbi:MAG TPA: glycine cleavage system protein H [Anaeromyxobacteraceae bacterium]|nr:glycine cleavage system protein H [Anaeromyxobacteraceae bacterium]